MSDSIYSYGDYCCIGSMALYGPTLGSKSHYVYVHRKKSSGDIFYVGIGKGNRCNQVYQRSDYWKRIYAKHGRIVEIVNSKLDIEKAKKLEIFYIEFLRGIGVKLCNLTIGGDYQSESIKRKVYMYSMNNVFIREFDSIVEANEFLGKEPKNSNITKCLNGTKFSFCRYVFKPYMTDDILRHKMGPWNKKAVYQYDLNGNFVKGYDSICDVDFVKHHTSVTNALDKPATAYGYFWRSECFDKIDAPVVVLALKEKKKVMRVSDGKIYDSIGDARRDNGFTRKKIFVELKKSINFVYYG